MTLSGKVTEMELILIGQITVWCLAELIKYSLIIWKWQRREISGNINLPLKFSVPLVLCSSTKEKDSIRMFVPGAKGNSALHYWDNLWASPSVPDIHTQERKAEAKQMQTRAIRMTGKQKSLAHSSYQTNAERGLGCSPQIRFKDAGG